MLLELIPLKRLVLPSAEALDVAGSYKQVIIHVQGTTDSASMEQALLRSAVLVLLRNYL